MCTHRGRLQDVPSTSLASVLWRLPVLSTMFTMENEQDHDDATDTLTCCKLNECVALSQVAFCATLSSCHWIHQGKGSLVGIKHFA